MICHNRNGDNDDHDNDNNNTNTITQRFVPTHNALHTSQNDNVPAVGSN